MELWHTELTRSNDVDTQGLKRDTAYVICMEREGDFVLIPCGHGGYSGTCEQTLLSTVELHPSTLYPICRASLEAIVRVQLSTPVGSEGEVLDSALIVRDASAPVNSVSALEPFVPQPVALLLPPPPEERPVGQW